jgi:hypothetical protein
MGTGRSNGGDEKRLQPPPQKICEFLQDMPQFSPAASLSGHATMKTMDNSRTAGLSSNVPR